MSVSVVVDEFDIFRTSISPDKTDTPLCVHADAVLASAVSRQPLQPIAWRNSEILYDVGGVNELELPQGRPLNRSIDSLRSCQMRSVSLLTKDLITTPRI